MSNPVDIPGRAEASASDSKSASAYSVSPNLPVQGTPPATPKDYSSMDFEELDANGHQLNTPWTFYFDRTVFGSGSADYAANLKKLYTVRCIESFWGIYNNIPSPANIQSRCGYHLMRDVRRPMWEDIPQGGSWKFRVPKNETETVWKELLLAVIGEQMIECMEKGDQVCGVSVSTRPMDDVMQVWNINADLAPKSRVMDKIRELVPDVPINSVFYKSHKETLKRGGGK